MTIRFNDKDLEGGNFIPEGKHEVKIASIENTQSKNGDPMFVFTLKDDLGREDKERILDREDMRWKLAAFAKAAGFTKEQLKTQGLNIQTLHGKRMLMVKTHTKTEEYQGKPVKRFENDYFPLQAGLPTAGTTPSSEDIPF